MMIRKLFFSIWMLAAAQLAAQVVTTEPLFPVDAGAVRIIFDASQGNAGLKDFTGDIWAHTGVITDKSETLTDWKYVVAGWSQNTTKAKLTSLGNNLWELNITPSIREYYNVPASEQILKMAFVFRNSDGSKTGRMADGSDVFADVYAAGLNVAFSMPTADAVVRHPGDQLEIQVGSNLADSVFFYRNDVLIQSVAGTSINLIENLTEAGEFRYKAIARKGDEMADDAFLCLVINNANTEPLPPGMRDGINYLSDNEVALVLFAPRKEFVIVLGDFNQWSPAMDYVMKKTPDGERFWLVIDGLAPGTDYVFQYWVDGDIRIADPYTARTSDPWNDKYISETTYPGLIPYPEGMTTQVASVLSPGEEAYVWKNTDFVAPPEDNLVIYELLVRDFLSDHSFQTLIDTLDYLQGLNINTIELMPVNEFEGNESWGYNPSFHFAVDKYYGPGHRFKALVDSIHGRGMAVVIDMVLNHAYGECPLVRLYWDAENNRPASDNPWFNVQSPNPVFSWGYDFNHESEATQRYVDSVNSYWMQEYRVDGFRYDFTKGFTNKPGDGGAYDASRIAILKRMAADVRTVKSDAYLILEHFATNAEEIELADDGFLIWGNVNYNYRMATQGWLSGNSDDVSSVSYKQRGWNHPRLVGYMESHDEERLMYDCLLAGNNQNPDHRVKNLDVALRRMELGAHFFIPVPGPKMIWMFGELGYDYSINYNGRVGNKPIRWDYANEPMRKRLYQVYSELNRLKTQYPVFSTDDFTTNLSDSVKTIHLNSDSMNVAAIGNFWIREKETGLNFRHTGWWYEYWTGDSLWVDQQTIRMTLDPGEYRLYTDVRLQKPVIISSLHEIPDAELNPSDRIELFPNPASERCMLRIAIPRLKDARLLIRNISGQVLSSEEHTLITEGDLVELNLGMLSAGFYMLEVSGSDDKGYFKAVKPLVIK